jgi:hypothetical protein
MENLSYDQKIFVKKRQEEMIKNNVKIKINNIIKPKEKDSHLNIPPKISSYLHHS